MGHAAKKDSTGCFCHEEERAFEGTWCTPELKKAEDLGYRIAKIHEVWHYPERGIVFAEYVNIFLKVEASSWLSECTSGVHFSTKEEYLRQFEERGRAAWMQITV